LAYAGEPPPPNLAAGALRHRLHCRIASPPSDLDPTAKIRLKPKSNPPLPVNHGSFAKEPLWFFKINPPSKPVGRCLQNSPFLYVLALGFFLFFTNKALEPCLSHNFIVLNPFSTNLALMRSLQRVE
jgi:hypothetical protein